MTWWEWVLIALGIWIAVGLAVGWVFGHMARFGGRD